MPDARDELLKVRHDMVVLRDALAGDCRLSEAAKKEMAKRLRQLECKANELALKRLQTAP